LFGSVFVSVQPLSQQLSLPVQICPLKHCGGPMPTHWLSTQAHSIPGGHSHGSLQPPQLFMSLVVSVQPKSQHVSEPKHAGPPLQVVMIDPTHVPLLHVSSLLQMFVQLPQWAIVSLPTQTSLQQRLPFVQPFVLHPAGGWQMPPRQLPVAHGLLHPPQSFGFVPSSTQPPLQHDAPPVQAAPPPHDGTHCVSRQMSPLGHWLVCRQPTQSPSFVSQMGLLAGHCELLVHPVVTGSHTCVAGSQASPVGHVSGFVRHATHLPCGSSQNGVAGVVSQPAFVVQPLPWCASASASESTCASVPELPPSIVTS